MLRTPTDTAQLATKDQVDAPAASVASLSAALAGMPDASTLLSNQIGATLAVTGLAGTGLKASREDHTHPARVQRTILTLAADGTASWTFTKPFDAMPSLGYMVVQAAGEPIIVDATGFSMGTGPTLGKYVSVAVKGRRSQPLPNLTAVSGLLTAVITGVNTLVSSLTGFNVFGGGSLGGVLVCLSAGDQM